MKCKNLNTEVKIVNVAKFSGSYKTKNWVSASSYSYYRSSSTTDQYNTHFTVHPTNEGRATFKTFHISLNFSSTGIRNAKIYYSKGKYSGYNDENLNPTEKKSFKDLFNKEKNHFDEMASQFWKKVQEVGAGSAIAHVIVPDNLKRNHIQRIKQTVEGKLLARPGVTAIDIDYKITNGKKTNELAIIVFVEKKKKVPSGEEIPKSIKGIKTDVWEGSFSPFSTVAAEAEKKSNSDLADPIADPIIGGISVGPCFENFYGTLGIVLDTAFGQQMMLSSAHVLATSPFSIPGSPISQPAVPFGGNCPNTFAGELFMYFIGQPYNIDAAIATINNRNAQSNFIEQLGQTEGTAVPYVGERVAKYGRRTGFTTGQITSNTLTFDVTYPNFGTYRYFNQLRIETPDPNIPFALSGDSGSMIINKENQVVGMIMSGTETGRLITVANPIQDIIAVFEDHNINFV